MTMRLCRKCKELFSDGGYDVELSPLTRDELTYKKCDNCGNSDGYKFTVRKRKLPHDMPV